MKMTCFSIFFQLPFTICNFIFALTSPHSSCFDQPHGGLVLRPWLLGIGITEIVLILGNVIPLLFFRCGCMSIDRLGGILSCVQGLTAIKAILWFIIVFVLFFSLVKFFCSGPIYTYFIVLMVFNCLPFVICCLCCCCGGAAMFTGGAALLTAAQT